MMLLDLKLITHYTTKPNPPLFPYYLTIAAMVPCHIWAQLPMRKNSGRPFTTAATTKMNITWQVT